MTALETAFAMTVSDMTADGFYNLPVNDFHTLYGILCLHSLHVSIPLNPDTLFPRSF